MARGVDSTGGERPREASGEDELGTGRGLEGDEVFLWPDIEAEGRDLTGHVLSILAVNQGLKKAFILLRMGSLSGTRGYLIVLLKGFLFQTTWVTRGILGIKVRDTIRRRSW